MIFNGNPVEVGVPGVREEMGLGEVLKGWFEKIGIGQCGGCKKRQEWLDDRIRFVPREGDKGCSGCGN